MVAVAVEDGPLVRERRSGVRPQAKRRTGLRNVAVSKNFPFRQILLTVLAFWVFGVEGTKLPVGPYSWAASHRTKHTFGTVLDILEVLCVDLLGRWLKIKIQIQKFLPSYRNVSWVALAIIQE